MVDGWMDEQVDGWRTKDRVDKWVGGKGGRTDRRAERQVSGLPHGAVSRETCTRTAPGTEEGVGARRLW